MQLTTELAANSNSGIPVTALFTAFHNIITEPISTDYIAEARKKFFCPSDVLEGLKSSIFAKDKEVNAYSLPSYKTVPGVPGLATTDPLVNC